MSLLYLGFCVFLVTFVCANDVTGPCRFRQRVVWIYRRRRDVILDAIRRRLQPLSRQTVGRNGCQGAAWSWTAWHFAVQSATRTRRSEKLTACLLNDAWPKLNERVQSISTWYTRQSLSAIVSFPNTKYQVVPSTKRYHYSLVAWSWCRSRFNQVRT